MDPLKQLEAENEILTDQVSLLNKQLALALQRASSAEDQLEALRGESPTEPADRVGAESKPTEPLFAFSGLFEGAESFIAQFLGDESETPGRRKHPGSLIGEAIDSTLVEEGVRLVVDSVFSHTRRGA